MGEAAIERALAALREYAVLGIRTNNPFLIHLVGHPEFRAGRLHTGLVDAHLGDLLSRVPVPSDAVAAAAAIPSERVQRAAASGRTVPDPWSTLAGWGR